MPNLNVIGRIVSKQVRSILSEKHQVNVRVSVQVSVQVSRKRRKLAR